MGMGGANNRADRRAARRAPHMVEMRQGDGVTPTLWTWVIGAVVFSGFCYIMLRSSPPASKPVGAPEAHGSASQEEQRPRDTDITMTRVTDDVFHLEFGGDYCDTVQCLKRATGLVLEQAPGRRIVSVAPVGAYGSTVLVVITAPTSAP